MSLTPEDQAQEPVEVEWLEPTHLITRLAELPQRQCWRNAMGCDSRWPAPRTSCRWWLRDIASACPKGSAASTHILKPAIAAVENSVTNEAFCMALAKRMKLRVADTQILITADRRILLVRRYDRRRDSFWAGLPVSGGLLPGSGGATRSQISE